MKMYKMSDYITPEDFIDFPHGVDIDKIVMTDKKINMLIDLAGQYVQNYIDFPFFKEQITDFRSGSGSNKILLNYANHTSNFISLKEINELGDVLEMSKSSYGFNKEVGAVTLRKQIFYPNYNYELKYTTGEIELPDNVKNAIILEGAYILTRQEVGEMNSIQIDIIKIGFNKLKDILPENVVELLSDYKIKERCI